MCLALNAKFSDEMKQKRKKKFQLSKTMLETVWHHMKSMPAVSTLVDERTIFGWETTFCTKYFCLTNCSWYSLYLIVCFLCTLVGPIGVFTIIYATLTTVFNNKVTYHSLLNELCADSNSSSAASTETDVLPIPVHLTTTKRKQQGNDQLITLQLDTLTAVNSLVAIQGELLQIKRAKFEIQREVRDMKRRSSSQRVCEKMKMVIGYAWSTHLQKSSDVVPRGTALPRGRIFIASASVSNPAVSVLASVLTNLPRPRGTNQAEANFSYTVYYIN